MKLNLESLKNKEAWKGFHLPDFDPAQIAENTRKKAAVAAFWRGEYFPRISRSPLPAPD